jgi:DNA topoisomerase-2
MPDKAKTQGKSKGKSTKKQNDKTEKPEEIKKANSKKPNSKPNSKTKKSASVNVEDIYDGMTLHQHILSLPDTYIGTTLVDKLKMFVYNEDEEKIMWEEIEYVAGFFKTFDEILVNARDHTVRDPNCKKIQIEIDRKSGKISVWNDGNGIPVSIHKKYDMYVPQMIFGNLLTSQNYNKKGKIIGGKNGYGAKLTNIYSKMFEVHTIGADKIKEVNGKIVPDEDSKKVEYKQTFKNNMYDVGEPIITRNISQTSNMFTKITYLPDYERFGMTGLTDDMYSLLVKRCYDIAACTSKTVSITLNGKDIKCRDFRDYIKMYYPKNDKDSDSITLITHAKINSRWELGIAFNKNVGDRQISFVNGISTFQGGTHVTHVISNVVSKVTEHINKQKDYKKLKILPATIKHYLTFFINCIVEDPGFNSQTKECMNSKVASWCTCGKKCTDVKCDIPNTFIKELCENGLQTEVVKMSQFKESRNLDKTDGKKVGKLRSVEKLLDAEWAGGRNSHKTSIFFTEGDSAKKFAIDGIGVIGNECYGVFPLKGKLLNVRNAPPKQIMKNEEFTNIKLILGLKQGMKYKDVSRLRYGCIITLTDQDPDGSHIKGLIINMLEYFWPELLQIEGFIKAYNTPIIKAWKKSDKKKENVKQFYTKSEFEDWKENKLKGNMSGWEHKYYKGLATSTAKEAKECFLKFDDNLVTFFWENDNDEDDNESEINKLKVNLAKKAEAAAAANGKSKNSKNKNDDSNSNDNEDEESNKDDVKNDDDDDYAYLKHKSHKTVVKVFDADYADQRKDWLVHFDEANLIEYKSNTKISYSDFFDRDMIAFSSLDNERSIPSITDGFKPSQRMIMFCCFKRGRKSKEVKVAQLSGYVSENTDYHHGEASLQGAIIGMAQNFPGSNNINLLKPNGNFGTRRQGGKDQGSARYIYTQIDPITNYIFREEDDEILEYGYMDGQQVEPKYYAPIIPMILINGSIGVGTGFSTSIPPHNPKEVITNLKCFIKKRNTTKMIPWFNGFKGDVQENPDVLSKYIISGKYKVDGNKVRIEDIPIVKGWIEDYEKKMDQKVSLTKDDNNKIEYIQKNPGNNIINMVITFKGQELQRLFKDGISVLEKYLMMTQNVSYTNLHLFNSEGKLSTYKSIDDIMQEFYVFRLKMYELRREFYLKKLQNDLDIANYKVKFIKEYLDGTLLLARQKIDYVKKQLQEKGYPRMARDHRTPDADKSYDYLTSMHIITLTEEKIKELEDSMEKCQAKYDEYLNTPIKDIWLRELDELLKAYDKWYEEWEAELALNDKDDKNKKGGKSKRKSKKNDDNENDNKNDKTKTPKTGKTKTNKTNNSGKNEKPSITVSSKNTDKKKSTKNKKST